jgi:sugar lactone lactonase YvrE/enterochelin esterase-like enzyme
MQRREFVSLTLAMAAAQDGAAQELKYGPDSQRQPGVPQGKVTKYVWSKSKIFPGTVRDYWVYVPAQYRGEEAAVMVFQDGGGFVSETGAWRTPIVLDNLIHKGEMPITVGIFINPGVLPALSENQQNRYNRCYEYDSLGERYARFLLEEILPEVGKEYRLTSDPNLRGLGGSSSGGICAFTAAWNRPDAFRRVLSFIGSYTNLRGGDIYPGLIRKTEQKPLRIYLQDGKKDLNIYSGNWFLANQEMASALDYAGYEHKFVVGEEGHNSRHGAVILPDALRWLWKDWQKPIAKPRPNPKSERHMVAEILDPDSEWETVSSGHRFTEGPAVDKDGRIYFTDIPANRIYRVELDGRVSIFREDSGAANGLMFGPDGRLYACQNGRKRIVAYGMDGSEETVAEDVNSNDLVVTARGEIYFTDPPGHRVWLIDARRNKRVVHEGLEFPNGIILSPDQAFLSVADSRGRWVWSFQIQADGSLAHGQPFYRLEIPDESSATGADGMTVDSLGYLYVTTRIGLQVFDQPAHHVAIINKPHSGPLSNVVFGGPELNLLYVTAGDRVFRRKVSRTGVLPWTLSKPPQPRL